MKATSIILLSAFFFFGFSANDGFKLVKTEDGVSLYERWYSIGNGKTARELKAVFTVRNDRSVMVSLLQNQSKGLEWNTGASQYAVRNLTYSNWITYICYDLPWPLDDQDCVLQYNRADASGRTVINFGSAAHAEFPVKSDISRIPNIKGRWLFSSLGGVTNVEYYITTTPSATLPRSITDPVVRSNLISGMARLKKLAE